jgi:cystathionine beta-lyase/cystathionine gamma-synthase
VSPDLDPDSLAVHAGRVLRARDPLSPPIVQAAVQVYESLEDYDLVASGEIAGHYYGRNSNETSAVFESAVAALEHAEAGLATASGMAALLVTILALCPRPAPVLLPLDVYGTTLGLLRQDLAPYGYEPRVVDLEDLPALERELPGAGLLICETVTNPLCRVPDLDALGAAAARARVPFLVDNTFATPILCRPLEHGATAVVHSATKYLGGHSDLVAGVVAGPAAVLAQARARAIRLGTTLGPFEAWLALRGLRTLGLRVRRQSANADLLAIALGRMPAVTGVHRASGERVRRLLPEGSGGMLAFDVDGGREAVQRLLDRLRLVRFAASLGGVETTVSHPELTSHRGLTPAERGRLGIAPGTVRVSTGIEAAADIIADFQQALGA